MLHVLLARPAVEVNICSACNPKENALLRFDLAATAKVSVNVSLTQKTFNKFPFLADACYNGACQGGKCVAKQVGIRNFNTIIFVLGRTAA